MTNFLASHNYPRGTTFPKGRNPLGELVRN